MCSIFQLLPGYTLPYDLLFNAIHNNEHGYGILLKSDKKIQVIKELPKVVDPDKVYKILKDNEDIERWVHLRNASQGEITMDNVQPIQVYHSGKRDVYFMHNGTIYSVYTPENQKVHILETIDDKKDSDSRKFALTRIAPLLTRFKGINGSADIEDPFLQEVINQRWDSTKGRAVLISSDQAPYLMHSVGWEKVQDGEGNSFLSSNDDYFKHIKRGTLFEKIKEEEDKKKPKNMVVVNGPPQEGIFILESPAFEKELSLSEDMVNILEEYDLQTEEGFIAMANIEHTELKKLFKDNLTDACTMFMYVCQYLKEATLVNRELTKKKKEKIIETSVEGERNLAERSVHVG